MTSPSPSVPVAGPPGRPATDCWQVTEVTVEPFPREPFTDDLLDEIADAAHERFAADQADAGLSSSFGVLGVQFFDDPPRPDERAAQVAALLNDLSIPGFAITARVEWTVMAKPDADDEDEDPTVKRA